MIQNLGLLIFHAYSIHRISMVLDYASLMDGWMDGRRKGPNQNAPSTSLKLGHKNYKGQDKNAF